MPVYVAWCLLGGGLLFHALPDTPAMAWAALVLPPAILARRSRMARWLFVLAIGFCWTWVRAEWRLAERIDASLTGRTVIAQGVVSSVPARRGDSTRFVFDVSRIDQRPVRLRARLSWQNAAPRPEAGEEWRLPVRLRRPRGFMNPGGFDYERWLFHHGLGATGYVRESPVPQRLESAAWGGGLARLRAAVAARIDVLMGDSPHKGLAIALGVGLRDGLDSQQWDVLRDTGTAHLVAISGLHIGMVASLVLVVVRRIWGFVPRLGTRVAPHDAALVCALLAGVGYAVLAGLSLPTQRAMLMLAFVLGGAALRRATPPGRSLAQALTVVLLLDPFAPLSAGFWLSFVAVASILLGLATLDGRARWLRVQGFVWLGLAPVSLWGFDRLSLVAPLVNLVLIPVFTLAVVPFVLTGVALIGWADPAAALALAGAGRVLDLVWPALVLAWELPAAVWAAPGRTLWQLSFAQCGVLLLLGPRGLPGRWLGVLFLLPAILAVPERPARGSYELAVLDVGQGLAAVVLTEHRALVFDTGPRFRSGSDTAGLVVLPYLRARGVDKLDALVISHGDGDHSGGAGAMIAAHPGAAMLVGGSQSGGRPCVAGEAWWWDGVRFEFLHPAAPGIPGNDGSCVLRVSARGGSVLLPGDIEMAAEKRLLERYDNLRSDIVVAPHHGSATSSTSAFVARTGARYAIFSAGHGNRWGFPREEVAERWRAAGAQCLDTARSGAIVFQVDRRSGISSPREHRLSSLRYWTAR